MNPELLLLIQIFASQQAYQVKILETLSVLYAKQEGFDDEKSQAFAKWLDADCEQSYQQLLGKLLETLCSDYPDFCQKESMESLLKRFSRN